MTNQQIKNLLTLALRKSNTAGNSGTLPPCYDVAKLVIQIELIISMLDEQTVSLMRGDSGKDIGDIK